MIKNFSQLEKKLMGLRKMKLAVASAQEEEVITAVANAYEMGFIEPVLIGDTEKIVKICKDNNINPSDWRIIESKDLTESAEISVKLVRQGEADFLIKGLIDTSILMKAVLNKEWGLRSGDVLSHVMIYQIPNYHKLLLITDGGVNIEPSLEEKACILKNAVKVARALEIDKIRVACLSAKEKVSDKMKSTLDAERLKRMGQEGYFGEDVVVEGPISFDLAISKESASVKGYESEVAGDADIILVPSIEVGNSVGKAITYFVEGSQNGGVVMGAKAPIVLVSRSDSKESKLYSIMLGMLISANA